MEQKSETDAQNQNVNIDQFSLKNEVTESNFETQLSCAESKQSLHNKNSSTDDYISQNDNLDDING